MKLSPIYGGAFCAGMSSPKLMNRKTLKAPLSQTLSNLNGPAEKSKAKGWVAAYTAGNASIAAAMAQMPGWDELALTGVEMTMTAHIFNGIYNFNLSKTALKSIATGIAGNVIGKGAFKLATKAVSWIPGIGNAINAVVAGSTTAALGAAIIDSAEDLDKARKNGKRLEDFLNEMEKK